MDQHNPFAETKWAAPMSYFSNQYVISFSDTDYNCYMANEDGIFSSYIDTGTYTFKGDSLFANSSGDFLSTEMYSFSEVVLSAKLSVDLLTVRFKVIAVGAPTPESEREIVFTKIQ